MSDSNDRQQLERRLLGWDVQTAPIDGGASGPGRDLVLALRTSGTRDLATVCGLPNLAQALTLALTTAKGKDPFNLEYGFDGLLALIEESAPAMQRERIRVSVVQTVTRDPRVSRIVDVQLDPPPGASTGAARQLGVRVAVETGLGQSIGLTVGVLGTSDTP